MVKNWAIDREFVPEIPEEERQAMVKGWSRAVKCAYGWEKNDLLS